LYDADDIDSVKCEIEPVGDRLVMFYSDRRNPHEVTEVCSGGGGGSGNGGGSWLRLAVTVWFFDTEEKRARSL
jgi:hypothetical protein